MNTTDYTEAEVEYAKRLDISKPTDSAEVKAQIFEMALRLARQSLAEVAGNPDQVTRRYKCIECGKTAEQDMQIDRDENGEIVKTAKGLVSVHWCCDNCGADFYNDIRLKNDEK